MNQIGPEQLLAQIRVLQGELDPGTNQVQPSAGGGFGDALMRAVDGVNDLQMASKELKMGYTDETGSASLAEVMIAAQKADLSFRAMTEVRNKLVTAYQDIMNMPV